MPKDIHLSNGATKKACVLVIENVTGISEERGFRLAWTDDNFSTCVPALGLATSNPFTSARAAADYGHRQLGETQIFLASRSGVLRLFSQSSPCPHCNQTMIETV